MTDAAAGEAAQPRSRQLGLWMTTALVVGNMIGSGVFLLPASLAPLGWNSVFGWVLTILGALSIAGVFCWLCKALPKEGGPYAYTRAAFGPLPAFLVAWSYWMSLWIGNAAIATAAISYLSIFAPDVFAVQGVGPATALALIWLLTLVNAVGARAAGGFALVTTLLKLVPLVVVIVLAAGALASGGASVAPMTEVPISGGAVTAAATLTLWAFLGLESATVPAGKIRDPQRTIPLATLAGTALAGLIYLITCSAVVLLMPVEVIAGSNAPFSDFVAHFWSPGVGLLVALFAAISCIGALNGWILLQAEMPYAMARAGAFPAWLGVESRFGTPVRALVMSSALMTVVVLLNYAKSMAEVFNFLLLMATANSLFMYFACTLAALWIARRDGNGGAAWLLPIAVIAAVYAAWTIYGAGGEAVGWSATLLAAGIPVYALMRYRGRSIDRGI